MIGFTGYWEKLEKLREFATARSLSMVELASAWLLSAPVVASVIAGATSAEQVARNAALDRMEFGPAARVKCSRGELTYPR